MTVSILLVTHEQLGTQMMAIAETICCQEIAPLAQVGVPANIDPQHLGKYADLIRDTMTGLDNGAGVLVLTDVFGATPDNLARYFGKQCNALVVSGVNLPMLLRVLHYPGQTLQQLCDTAICGAKSGIQPNGIQPS
jgi:PTS system mannose-specific IIA component